MIIESRPTNMIRNWHEKKHLRPDRHAHIIPVRKKAVIAKTLHGKTTARPRTVLPHHAEKTIKKNSRYQQVRRQKMMLAGGGLLLLLLVIIFSARACISSRKAAEAAALQKAQEEAAAKKAEEAAKAAQKDPVSLTISVVGDCTLGTDETFDYDTSLNAYYDSNGKDYFFQNVKKYFCSR